MTRFEWDEGKKASNRRKHGIAFEEACGIFDGPVLTIKDEGLHGELRERSFGLIGGVSVLCVVHTDRQGSIRIISARKATANEKRHFDKHLKKALG